MTLGEHCKQWHWSQSFGGFECFEDVSTGNLCTNYESSRTPTIPGSYSSLSPSSLVVHCAPGWIVLCGETAHNHIEARGSLFSKVHCPIGLACCPHLSSLISITMWWNFALRWSWVCVVCVLRAGEEFLCTFISKLPRQPEVHSSGIVHLFFLMYSLTNLGLSKLTKTAGQKAPGLHMALPS